MTEAALDSWRKWREREQPSILYPLQESFIAGYAAGRAELEGAVRDLVDTIGMFSGTAPPEVQCAADAARALLPKESEENPMKTT